MSSPPALRSVADVITSSPAKAQVIPTRRLFSMTTSSCWCDRATAFFWYSWKTPSTPSSCTASTTDRATFEAVAAEVAARQRNKFVHGVK